MSIYEQLRDTIATALNLPAGKVTETSSAEDIAAWDSLGHVHVIMALEQTFGIFLDVEDFPRMNSVPAIIAYLKEHGLE